MARRCKNLVLDSGPLLSLLPLRGLADSYFTVPQVLDELKDKRAREHFERLGLSTGVRVNIQNPDPVSLTQVIQCAKTTGDYAVLSHADICVLALTYALQREQNALAEREKEKSNTKNDGEITQTTPETAATTSISTHPNSGSGTIRSLQTPASAVEREDLSDLCRATKDLLAVDTHPDSQFLEADDDCSTEKPAPKSPIYDDPSTDEDDGEGEWITLDNLALHRSRALELLPSSDEKRIPAVDEEKVLVGCMTADFAMQNVLLQMGLTLVGTEGKRIQKVKTWVLRCHACFKTCKDNSKQFCPSCGNPTLIRASVTLTSPNAAVDAPVMQVHLKNNFQYKLRGTKYSIPAPRPGSAKTGPGEGLVLREDQSKYLRAKERADGKRKRDEHRMLKGLIDRGGDGVAIGSWSDPDWIPGILGGSTRGGPGNKTDMPQIGYGRRNPNERRKH